MNDKRTYTLDKERLEQYNEMKPAAKKVLGFTARVAVKMLKMIVKAAWLLPGVVRKLAASDHARADDAGANHAETDRGGPDRGGSDRGGSDREKRREKKN